VPDRRLVEEVAAALGTRPGLVEKDWQVVRAIGVIAGVDTARMRPAFSGGTSLLKGWELIKLLCEGIETCLPATSKSARQKQAACGGLIVRKDAQAPFIIAPATGSGSTFRRVNSSLSVDFVSSQNKLARHAIDS